MHQEGQSPVSTNRGASRHVLLCCAQFPPGCGLARHTHQWSRSDPGRIESENGEFHRSPHPSDRDGPRTNGARGVALSPGCRDRRLYRVPSGRFGAPIALVSSCPGCRALGRTARLGCTRCVGVVVAGTRGIDSMQRQWGILGRACSTRAAGCTVPGQQQFARDIGGAPGQVAIR